MPNKNLKENKIKRMIALPFRGLIKKISPTLFVKMQYRYITKHRLDLKHPKRYTEKLQYLRLRTYPKNPLVSMCASREGVRKYLKNLKLEEYLIPIYGIFDRFSDIDFDNLPNQFVMKCTHACAFNYICRDKSKIEIKALRVQFDKWLSINYGKKTLELHYSPIKPQIIIEKYLGEIDSLPIEYKLHCFNGVAKSLYVVSGRNIDIRYDNLLIDWTPFDGSQFNGWKKSDTIPTKPENFADMIKIAEKLSKPFPFVRVDLYNIAGKIYFSEMTFTPAKGTLILDDDNADFIMGEWLDIALED